MNDGYFKDKVVLISGSSRGVGYAMAKQVLQAGGKAVITARNIKRLEESRAKLSEFGEVIALQGDVGVSEDARHLIDACIDHFGRLDILINNAGISMRGKFDELELEVMDTVVQTNLMGSIYLSKFATPYLKETKGQIIFISSIAGLLGLPNASVYCASKGALRGLCESLRIELSPYGIQTGIVYLGFTEHDPEKRIIAGDGKLVLPDRPAHHTQEQAAKLILEMTSRRRRHIAMTPIGKVAYVVSRYFPYLVERIISFARGHKLKMYQRFS